MPRTPVGTIAVGGLAGAPDVGSIARLAAVVGRYRADTAGGGGVIGYDRGDPARSFAGPVSIAPSPARAYAAIGTPAGIYQPDATAQDTWSNDPALNSWRLAAFNRMQAGQ